MALVDTARLPASGWLRTSIVDAVIWRQRRKPAGAPA